MGAAILLVLAGHASGAPTDPAGVCHAPPPPGLAAPDQDRKLVLIIDDMGNRLREGRAVVALPGKLTIAVLPQTPHGPGLARAAHKAGKEVMLHAPMSNLAGTHLGQGGLTAEQSEADFRATLAEAIDDLPHVMGVNNHMGSELTQRRRQMAWVMDTLREKGLYFIDSRTSALTVAADVAAAYGVPHLSRKVFIDNSREPVAIDDSFRRLLDDVERTGLAVGIGHPYPETIAYLRGILPRLPCRGIRLALVSEVLRDQKNQIGKALSPGGPVLAAASTASEPHLDAPFSHIGLGFGYRVFAEVEYAGGEHRVGTAEENTLHEVFQITDTP